MSDTTDDPAQRSDGDVPQQDLIAALEESRQRFLALVAHLRPDLHRYCARMAGSTTDGEDIVQDVLAQAYYQLPELKAPPQLRPWLFRIAHNKAIDHLRGEAYRRSEPLEEALDVAGESGLEPDSRLAGKQAVKAALSSYLALPPTQRACVILKDVLDHSLEEIAAQLDLSVQAVKAALHRGRTQLRAASGGEAVPAQATSRAAIPPALARYAQLFNAHDWDGVRAMLADDVKLDLVSRRKYSGKDQVGTYYGNYAKLNWHLVPAWLEGRAVLAIMAEPDARRASYFMELEFIGDRVCAIRDFHFVPYIAQEAEVRFAA